MKDLDITQVTLASVTKATQILSKKIVASPDTFPTFGGSEQSGRPHVEIYDHSYHYVVCERGQEFERRITNDVYELLYWIFADITFELACSYELGHRQAGKDTRRLLFQKQEELLSILDIEWSKRKERDYVEILKHHPFNDNI